ncbi:protein kinase domain-containing protein [Sorangium sp. So ce1000]|uniref:serine/threonine-protein kinase n=1 Tax=Sorangium sp. So ce1000 TaxID=3133325 RepID=UPI003F63BE22
MLAPIPSASSAPIAGRYAIRRRLGHGAFGEVWAADDLLTGTLVAVKLLDRGAGNEPARVRREVAALRLLRLPGVVRMLDEGIDQGIPFLVMEHLAGAPFPGQVEPRRWAAIAGVTARLLQTLGRIHAAGVIHRDLKPENVLVDAEGRPTILDFGLSFRGAVAEGPTADGALLGTPAYFAPEQILGDPVSPATDLYALGVMLYESLSGRLPHEAGDLAELLRARLTGPVAPLEQLAPDVPPAVARLIDRLLSRAPEDRPRSAEEVRGQLHGVPELLEGAALPQASVAEAELRSLFAGPDRLFHLQEDAAHELWVRTQGHPDRVAAEVAAWVHGGLARRDGERLVIDRDALDDLEAERTLRPSAPAAGQSAEQHRAAARELSPSAAGRLFHLIAGQDARRGASAADVAAEAVTTALLLAHAGQLGRAIAVLSEGLLAARRGARRRGAGEGWGEARLLGCWVQIAISDGKPRALDRVLYEICRAGERTAELAALEGLVRAALAVRTMGSDRALAMLDASVPPFADLELDRVRQHLRVLAARRGPAEREEAVLAEVSAWAAARGDAEAEASLADWLGRLRYRQGRFEEAAQLHACAAEAGRWTTARIDARLNGASALMEAFAFDAAREQAEAGRALARGCRHAYFEGRAEWLLRTVAYRSGQAEAPDHELVELAARLDVAFLEGAVCLTEAAVAWRAGRLDEALALAERAARSLVGTTEAGVLLARSLALACGGAGTEADALALAERAARCSAPGVGIQALALLSRVCPAVQPALREAAGPLTAAIPRRRWGERMDILSVAEALDAGRLLR